MTTPAFAVGDKVAYSVQFLRSIGDMAHARGVISGFTPLGRGTLLAEITWDREMPGRVNVGNLAKVGPNRRFCNID